jgi:Ca2+/Na+ antiporter
MGEVNDEKLKQILDGYSKMIQDKIDAAVNKAVGEIKGKLKEQENYSALIAWLSFGVAVFAIGIALLIYGADKVNSHAFNTGLGILGLSVFIFIIGSLLNMKLSIKKR